MPVSAELLNKYSFLLIRIKHIKNVFIYSKKRQICLREFKMFNKTWQFWIEKYRVIHPNYNIDSVTDTVYCTPLHSMADFTFPVSVLTSDDEPHSPPSWRQVYEQFNYALDCASSSIHDENFINIQRQAFITLWTLHAVDDWQKHCTKTSIPEYTYGSNCDSEVKDISIKHT